MERVGAAHRARTVLGHHRGNEIGSVSGHMGDLSAALRSKQVEKRL
jgi:hypothetical protein